MILFFSLAGIIDPCWIGRSKLLFGSISLDDICHPSKVIRGNQSPSIPPSESDDFQQEKKVQGIGNLVLAGTNRGDGRSIQSSDKGKRILSDNVKPVGHSSSTFMHDNASAS